MRLRVFFFFGLLLSSCGPNEASPPDFSIDRASLKSGYSFLTPDSQALQSDEFSNPGLLWVEMGAELFSDSSESKNCLSCHADPDREFGDIVSRYPFFDQGKGLIGIEDRINHCRVEYQNAPEFTYESEALLSLTSFVKSRSSGKTIKYVVNDELRPHFERGKDYFYSLRGQLNLSCHQCHDRNWGAKMRGDIVSQGHINGFPAYRNDWQTLGSAHKRFEACDMGVRAQPHALGSQTYLELEVYLMARGNGLKVETPAIRR